MSVTFMSNGDTLLSVLLAHDGTIFTTADAVWGHPCKLVCCVKRQACIAAAATLTWNMYAHNALLYVECVQRFLEGCDAIGQQSST